MPSQSEALPPPEETTPVEPSEPTSPPSAPPSAPASAVEIFIVRHGERADETAEKVAFYRTCGERWWDPPLTASGKAQADVAGRALQQAHAAQPFDAVLCSPTLRTVQTASHVAAALGLPVRRVPGLSECAAAIKQIGLAAVERAGEADSLGPQEPKRKADAKRGGAGQGFLSGCSSRGTR